MSRNLRPLLRALPAILFASVAAIASGGCRGMSMCESPCWPGPRIGPQCPSLCCEPPREQPCVNPCQQAPTAPTPCAAPPSPGEAPPPIVR